MKNKLYLNSIFSFHAGSRFLLLMFFLWSANSFGQCTPPVATASGTTPVCVGNTANLFSGGGANYSWSGPNGFNSTDQNPVLSNMTTADAGTYTVTVTNGCGSSTAHTTVVVNSAVPIPTATPSDTSFCSGGKTNLRLTSNLTGTSWSYSPGVTGGTVTGATSGNAATSMQILTNTGSTPALVTYTITASKGGCSSTTSATVTVKPKPGGSATPSTFAICSGSRTGITLHAGLVGSTTFTWTVASPLNITGTPSACSSDCDPAINDSLYNTGNSNSTVTYSITPWADGCAGTVFKDMVTVRPVPVASSNASHISLCSGKGTGLYLKSNVSGTVYTYTASMTVIPDGVGATINGFFGGAGSAISQTLSNTGTSPGTIVYTINPSYLGCPGISTKDTVDVNPVANGSATPSPVAICSASRTGITLHEGSVSGTTFTWTFTATNLVSGTAAACLSNCLATINDSLFNNGPNNGTVTFYIKPWANGCAGTIFKGVVTVRPIPIAATTATNTTICSNTKTAIALTSTTYGTKFQYTAFMTNTPVGGTIEGTIDTAGSKIYQKLINTGVTPGIVIYTITPGYYGCYGDPIQASVTINPVANGSVDPAIDTILPGTRIAVLIDPGTVAGTKFTWTCSAPVTITGTPSGCNTELCGTSITDSLFNTSTSYKTVTYTIIPSANQCPGPKIICKVVVKPKPVITNQANYAYCSATKTNVRISSSTYGTTFSYTATLYQAPDIGTLTGYSDGSGSVIAQTLVNPGNTPAKVVYEITPNYQGSIGNVVYDTITVNPVPHGFATPAAKGICSGSSADVTLSGTVAGSIFVWTAGFNSLISGANSCLIKGSCGNIITDVLTTLSPTGPKIAYSIVPWANNCSGIKFMENVTVQLANTPAKPNIYATVTTGICPAPAQYTYTVTNAPPFSTVNWGLPSGCTYDGNLYNLHSNPIVISYPVGYVLDNILASVTNTCQLTSITGSLSTSSAGSICRMSGVSQDRVNSNISLSAYPNPAHDKLNVIYRSDAGAECLMKLFDITGRIVYDRTANAETGENHFDIALGGFSKGIYILSFTSGEQNMQIRIVVE